MDKFEVNIVPDKLVTVPFDSPTSDLGGYVRNDNQITAFFRAVCLQAVKLKASDIFWKVGSPPCFAVSSKVVRLDVGPMIGSYLDAIFKLIAGEKRFANFPDHPELDISYEIAHLSRFRVNFYRQRGQLAFVMRLVPLEIPTLEELGLPLVLEKMAFQKQGLILVTGPTGSGKSTTIAALIDRINSTRRVNIVTIEDPIEFSHHDKLSLVSQREVGHGMDTESFSVALREVLRQAPNVILIGEMRDRETMSVAMQAAETGHLVLSTVHTNSAAETIERIVNLYDVKDKSQICLRLANSFLGICSQKLIPKRDGSGRVCAAEILVNTPTVAKQIEDGNTTDIHKYMDDEYWQMQSMNRALLDHFLADRISEEDVKNYSPHRAEMEKLIHNAKRDRTATA